MQGTLHKDVTDGKWYIKDIESDGCIQLCWSDYMDFIADSEDASIPDGDYEGDAVEYGVIDEEEEPAGYIIDFIRTKFDNLDINDLL